MQLYGDDPVANREAGRRRKRYFVPTICRFVKKLNLFQSNRIWWADSTHYSDEQHYSAVQNAIILGWMCCWHSARVFSAMQFVSAYSSGYSAYKSCQNITADLFSWSNAPAPSPLNPTTDQRRVSHFFGWANAKTCVFRRTNRFKLISGIVYLLMWSASTTGTVAEPKKKIPSRRISKRESRKQTSKGPRGRTKNPHAACLCDSNHTNHFSVRVRAMLEKYADGYRQRCSGSDQTCFRALHACKLSWWMARAFFGKTDRPKAKYVVRFAGLFLRHQISANAKASAAGREKTLVKQPIKVVPHTNACVRVSYTYSLLPCNK